MMKTVLLSALLVTSLVAVTPPATAGCPPIDDCVGEVNEVVDFLLGGCYEGLPHPRLDRICWAP